jgi:hypothetical protein
MSDSPTTNASLWFSFFLSLCNIFSK